MLPPASRPYALAEAAAGRLFAELSLTPKPGLVDRADNGAHRDMDFSLMAKSIHALRPYFARLAKLGQLPALPNYDRIAAIGREAEAAMEKTTGGVNTHRGALFSLGLAIIAAARLTASEPFCLTAESLRRTIQQLASGFPQPQATHGAAVLARTRVKGAVAMAREGYTDLFEEWLPYYQRLTSDDAPYRLLLKIMTGLDDTNVIHRVGTERATIVKKEAETLLADFSLEKLGKLNTLYIRENISPGGAADMWSLTTFIAALLPHTEKQNP